VANLSNIPDFDPSFWKQMGDEIADRVRVHTQLGGKDVHGKAFKKYSPGYAERKPKIKRGGSTGSKVNLTLTGDMMRNLQVRGFNKNGVVIGWSGVNAQKVGWNDEMGRTVTTKVKPVSSGIERFINKQVDSSVKKNAKEATKKPITFTIGK
tara:strand:+ start:2601 stop:3056 length:456 start_codon:yes stop_codon:yes gene_type:complete